MSSESHVQIACRNDQQCSAQVHWFSFVVRLFFLDHNATSPTVELTCNFFFRFFHQKVGSGWLDKIILPPQYADKRGGQSMDIVFCFKDAISLRAMSSSTICPSVLRLHFIPPSDTNTTELCILWSRVQKASHPRTTSLNVWVGIFILSCSDVLK